LVIAADISPDKAPDIKEPENMIAVGRVSSFRVYHEDKKNKTPGKYAASTNPSKNRQAINWPKVCTIPVAVDRMPQIIIHVGRYSAGIAILLRNKFDGTR
jgi:hypothetical protein